MDKNTLDRSNIVQFIADIFHRRGAESYLGEAVSMSQHMLQTAQNAEKAGEPPSTITAALLHDIGHYTGEFPEDYIEQGIDNMHQKTGAAVLERFFEDDVLQPIRWHVEAKRYLCAVDPAYFATLSPASVETLKLQGGPFSASQVETFKKNPHMETIVRVRKYDDSGKEPNVETPPIEYYLPMVQAVLDGYR